MSVYKEYLDSMQSSLTGGEILETAQRKRKTKSIRKVYAALAITAAVFITGAVTVGAACNWDFKSLLMNDYSRERKTLADVYNEAPSWFSEPFMYEGTVEVPEGVGLYHQMNDRELELLDMITIPVEKTFEYEDYSLIVHGVLYDGYNMMIKQTVIDNSGVMDHQDSNVRHQFWYYCPDNDGNELFNRCSGGGGSQDMEKDRYHELLKTALTFPDDMKTAEFSVGHQYTDSTGFTSYPVSGGFTIEIPDVSGLHRTYDLDRNTMLGGYKESHLRTITVSPTGAFIEFDFNLYKNPLDINNIHLAPPPVFITMNDDTVITLQGGFGNYDVNEDGTFYCSWQLNQIYYMIDPFDIYSVQIGDLTIELDDSMIIG